MNQNQWKKVKRILIVQEPKGSKKIFNKLRDRLTKPKIKENRKDLYRIEHKKIKEI